VSGPFWPLLGHRKADAVTMLGAGVDGTVRLVQTAYAAGGWPYPYSTYSDVTGQNRLTLAFSLWLERTEPVGGSRSCATALWKTVRAGQPPMRGR
jgi:hypothetical protein